MSVGAPTWRGLKPSAVRPQGSWSLGVSRCPDMEGIETCEENRFTTVFVRVSRCPDMEGIETATAIERLQNS